MASVRMRIVAVATHKERMFDLFVESAHRHKIRLDILGMGETWRGFGWRWTLILAHLETVDDDELILVTDAFDTLILKDSDAFAAAFRALNAPIVFSKEPDAAEFHPCARYYRWRLFGKDPVVNGGTYMGTCGALRTFLRRLKYTDTTDDQRLLTRLHKLTHMRLDASYTLMYHCVGWRRKQTLPDTCVVTFPAEGHTPDVLSQLGYAYEPPPTQLTLRRLRHYVPFFWREIVCVLTVMWML